MTPLTPQEARKRDEDYTAHAISFLLTGGFFAIALVALLGVADIKDPTVAAFVGTALGYAAAKLDGPLSRYFKYKPPPKGDT